MAKPNAAEALMRYKKSFDIRKDFSEDWTHTHLG